MGTRHLICAISDDEYRIAQYGQWEGYPEGQGAAILEFLKSPMVEQLRKNLERCSWITNDEYCKLWEEFGVDTTQLYVDCDMYEKFYEIYPQLSRDTGAKILEIVAGATDEIKLQNSLDFSQDSLFCEWAYVIDFDKNTFEVYQGFIETPFDASERFYTAGQEDDNGLYPFRLIKTFDLSALPSEEEFLEICEPAEDEPEEEMAVDFGRLMGI